MRSARLMVIVRKTVEPRHLSVVDRRQKAHGRHGAEAKRGETGPINENGQEGHLCRNVRESIAVLGEDAHQGNRILSEVRQIGGGPRVGGLRMTRNSAAFARTCLSTDLYSAVGFCGRARKCL